jgi:electron transfer flavoprotein beta subunit
MLKAKLPCLITALAELNTPRYMTPGGIFDAYRTQQVKTLTRADLDIDDSNIGLKGSPTRVFRSFTKGVKGKGTVVTFDPQESADWIVDRLAEKFIL